MTSAERIIRWIESECGVPEGALVGQPLVLMDWQKREILRIYDNPAGTRRAIVSGLDGLRTVANICRAR